MKTICLFSPGILPIPAVKGGAIETLLELLIEQNEIEKKVRFLVVSVHDEEAEARSQKYKQTDFIYIKRNLLFAGAYKALKILARKLFNFRFSHANLYYWLGVRKVLAAKPDAVVAEGGNYATFSQFTQTIGKENVFLHLHQHLRGDAELDDIFGEVLTVSYFVKDEWLTTSNMDTEKVTVLPNAIDNDRFTDSLSTQEKAASRMDLGLSPTDFVVLFCGRIVPEKGVKELILALEKVADPTVKLLIMGSPNFALKDKSDYLAEVEDLVKKNADRMVFTGYVANEETYRYYAIADVVSVPTLIEEAAGLVVLEAMAVGRPLIVTNSGGIPEYATPELAMILERNEDLVNNLAASITTLKGNGTLRSQMAKNAKERSLRYSKKVFYTDFVDRFKGI